MYFLGDTRYKKGKFARHDFINFDKLKLQMIMRNFLACAETYAKKVIDKRFFSRNSKFANIVEIDNKSNMKPKRHPMIHVGLALFTILVSYK